MSCSGKSNDPQEDILEILRERGGAQTAGTLRERAVNHGISRRRFFRHLRKLVDDRSVQKELLRDGRIETEAYSIREPGDRGLFELVCDSLGEKLIDYLDNDDKRLDLHGKASKIAMLLALAKEVDEGKEVGTIAGPRNAMPRKNIREQIRVGDGEL